MKLSRIQSHSSHEGAASNAVPACVADTPGVRGSGEIALKTDDLEVVASMQRRAEEVEAHSITLKPRGHRQPVCV